MSKGEKRVPEELARFLEKYPDTQQLELLQPDMLGILRGKRVGRDEMGKPFGDGLNFCGATVLLDAQGQTFDRIDNGGRDGDPDAISTAVPGLYCVPSSPVPSNVGAPALKNSLRPSMPVWLAEMANVNVFPETLVTYSRIWTVAVSWWVTLRFGSTTLLGSNPVKFVWYVKMNWFAAVSLPVPPAATTFRTAVSPPFANPVFTAGWNPVIDSAP